MNYDFDRVIERRNTNSAKWDLGQKDLFPMWVADMDFKSPKSVIDAIKQRADHGVFGYTILTDSFYQPVINWMKKRHGWKLQKDWIMFSPGVVPAIIMLIRGLTHPGDKVIIQPPVYYPFANAIKNNGRHVVENELLLKNGRYYMDFKDLEKKAKDPRTKLIILCSPHNPIGRVWTRDELKRLGKICIVNGVTIISDEIHCDLVYKGFKHTPFASISDEFAHNSVTCTAPSKTFNLPGLQTSSIIIPNPKLRTIYEQMQENSGLTTPNVFGLTALNAAYSHGEEWLEQVLDYISDNLEFLINYVEKHIPRIKVIKPEATYLVWLDCRELGLDAGELEDLMLNKAKLWLDEGYIFGKAGEGFERMVIACPRTLLKEGLHRMEKAIKSLSNLHS